MFPILRRVALWASFAASSVTPLFAQRVRGEVVRQDGVTAALGVVVAASSATGTTVTRVLSGANGVFDLRLPAAGTYTFTALRIGFKPTVVAGVVVADTGVARVRLVLSGTAVMLAAVDVRSKDVCGTSHDPQSQVVQVWSEARTALASAALWSRELLDAEWISFKRELQVGNESVRSQEVHTTRSTTTHAFKSWDAESLAARGYVQTNATGSTYHAPDADVLLSDSFAETHCFHVEPSPVAGAGLVGVGFTPQNSRNGRADIEGTLWIDRASSELRWLDFRYVGLPAPAGSADAGGRVEFLRLADGPWMVSRWHIRMPLVGAGPAPAADRSFSRTVLKQGEPTLYGISVSGGMISHVGRRGEELYRAVGSGLALQLVRSDSETTVANALVKLDGTDYAWRADSTGLVRAMPVLDGRYTAQIATTEMLALETEPIAREVVVRTSTLRVDSAVVPSAREILRRGCGADAVKGGLAALYGVVLDSAGRPAAARGVTASWGGSVSTGGVRQYAGRITNGTMSGDAGQWHLCEVPRGRPIAVRAVGDDGQVAAEVMVPESRWIINVPLRLKAGVVTDADSTTALLELTIKDAAGTALGITAIELTAWTGEQRKVTTDARGRLLVAGFPPGMTRLRAKRAGYQTGDVMFTAVAGRNTVPLILGQATPPMLDTVRVAGNRRTSSRMDGFETRRARREATASWNAEEIAKRNPAEISDLLRSVLGIRMLDSAGVIVGQMTRGTKFMGDPNAPPCLMRVVLDGVVLPTQAGVNVVRPSEVRGLEIFASTSRTPTGLGITSRDAACGLIAIYTGKNQQ